MTDPVIPSSPTINLDYNPYFDSGANYTLGGTWTFLKPPVISGGGPGDTFTNITVLGTATIDELVVGHNAVFAATVTDITSTFVVNAYTINIGPNVNGFTIGNPTATVTCNAANFTVIASDSFDSTCAQGSIVASGAFEVNAVTLQLGEAAHSNVFLEGQSVNFTSTTVFTADVGTLNFNVSGSGFSEIIGTPAGSFSIVGFNKIVISTVSDGLGIVIGGGGNVHVGITTGSSAFILDNNGGGVSQFIGLATVAPAGKYNLVIDGITGQIYRSTTVNP